MAWRGWRRDSRWCFCERERERERERGLRERESKTCEGERYVRRERE